MSDMSVLRVKNRDFQRTTAQWLRKARAGDTIIIETPNDRPLTLKAERTPKKKKYDWDEHWRWLKSQPALKENPIDEIRRWDNR